MENPPSSWVSTPTEDTQEDTSEGKLGGKAQGESSEQRNSLMVNDRTHNDEKCSTLHKKMKCVISRAKTHASW